MGLYIRPAEDVITEGVAIRTPATYAEAKNDLRKGECLSAVAHRPHGMVALLISHEADFKHVQQSGGTLYIIEQSLAARAY